MFGCSFKADDVPARSYLFERFELDGLEVQVLLNHTRSLGIPEAFPEARSLFKK